MLTVLIHLCLRLNWLSRYVIVLLFDNIIIVVVVMIVLILFMTLLNFVVFILLFVIFLVCMSKFNGVDVDFVSINRTPTCSLFINKKSTCSLFIHKMYMKSCFFSLNNISCIECIVFSYICLLRIFFNNTLL